MPNFDKWIQRKADDETAGQVAVRSIAARLMAVEYYLPLAACRADENIEFVHQLRVSTRRSVAAMDLYQDLLPKRESKWIRKRLKRVRRAAGHARDLDVLALSHQEDNGQPAAELLNRVKKQRHKAQRPIQKVYQQLSSKQCFARHSRALLCSVGKGRHNHHADQLFDDFARTRLKRILNRFFESSVYDTTDLTALHRFRIAGKELRYAMELLSPAFPDSFREELYPVVEQLQDRLGEINDHAVASQRFGRWMNATHKKRKIAGLKQLMRNEQADLEMALERYSSWWTKKYANKLRRSFDRILSNKAKHQK